MTFRQLSEPKFKRHLRVENECYRFGDGFEGRFPGLSEDTALELGEFSDSVNLKLFH